MLASHWDDPRHRARFSGVGFRLGSAGLVVLWTTAGCELAFPLDRYGSLPDDGGPAESGAKDSTSTDSRATDGDAPALITYVQGNVVSVKTKEAVVALDSVVRSHDAIIVCIDVDDKSVGLTSPTDTLGNNYGLIFGPISASPRQYFVYLAQDIDGGASTSVTAMLSNYTNSVFEVFALEYSGLASSNAFDTSSDDMGTSMDVTSGPAM